MSETATADSLEGRSLGLLQAMGVGVGAIVGGGILALAGVAFATTGPSAVVAFALNGLIALLTALTFAEMATSFPESGGTYTFAKKVLSVEAAFMVGWVVWFASIVAAVLYALGFAAFFRIFLAEAWQASGGAPPPWILDHAFELLLAVAATAFYARGLMRRQGGGGLWETGGKVVVFVGLLAAGVWVLPSRDPAQLLDQLTPFFAAGGLGLLQAMGYTFIALQGFDLIAAVGGQVREPSKVLPRAMIGSLLIALAIYLPLLLLVATVGVAQGDSIIRVAAADPEAVVAIAVEQYLGRTGFWLVIVAALLSMLSALQANLLAASHIALAMARDRNLPGRLRQLHGERGTPVGAVLATSGTVILLLLAVPDVAVAGAMSSLIFLLSFTLAHLTGILTRRRGGGREDAFLLPFFPLVPVVGGLACLGLAVFQGLAVPSAGAVAAAWLASGGALYVLVFSRRARVADAAAEALDPQLARLRGRAPLVLVPIANPASARSLVTLASALAPPRVGKVLLLYVVETPERWSPEEMPPHLVFAQEVLGRALNASFAADLAPEALITVSPEPWSEIGRVARTHACESLLLGLGDLAEPARSSRIEVLTEEVGSDVV
ncbi:MAG: amino acid permease, partial [Holophagales bacterium]|nr:amino acid permease [Holophagales bacterium]